MCDAGTGSNSVRRIVCALQVFLTLQKQPNLQPGDTKPPGNDANDECTDFRDGAVC